MQIFTRILSATMLVSICCGPAAWSQDAATPETPVGQESSAGPESNASPEASDDSEDSAPENEAAEKGTAEPAAAEPTSAENDEFPNPNDVSREEAARILIEQMGRPDDSSMQDSKGLRLNFSGASWKDVLQWLAEEADLSLQIDRYPTGSVNFVDTKDTYSVSQTMDLLNRLLLDRGHALVRRGRMLFLIDLEVENADKLISEMAELVSLEDLDERARSEIVSAVFSLGSMTPDQARQQLPEMVGPWGRVIVLESARQAKVTETVGKLLAIRTMIENSSQEVFEMVLKNRDANEILDVARPLLSLEPDENSNDDIRISVGLYGDRIYAIGLPSKISILRGVVEKADQPLKLTGDESDETLVKPFFKSHPVTSADIATVFEVLQTLLQDEPSARIAIEPATKSIVALGRPSTHETIAEIIDQLEGKGKRLEIIQLNRLDPAQALLTINKLFGVTEEEPGDGPTVDGDPGTGKLWVHGTEDQITQVRELIEKLDGENELALMGGRVRMLPYSGRDAEQALQQLEAVWQRSGNNNRIRVITPSGRETPGGLGIPERKIYREGEPRAMPSDEESIRRDERQIDPDDQVRRNSSQRFYYLTQTPAAVENDSSDDTEQATGRNADIVIQVTPNGLLVASDDIAALDQMETLLGMLVTPTGATSDVPTIYWLKYIKADATAEFLAEIMGGGDSSLSSVTDSLMGGMGGGMLGGLMGGMMGGGGGGGESSSKSILTSTGSVNIVPEMRLNALFVQAGPTDLQFIDMVLEKIDRVESPEDIELVNKPQVIPVLYQDAAEVAKVVKEVYQERIEGQEKGGGGGGGRGGGQPSPQDFIAALRGGGGRGGGGGSQPAKSEPAKISISVDTLGNSLIVRAPPQEFAEIQLLVRALDDTGKENEVTTSVITVPGGVNGDAMLQALTAVMGEQKKKTETTPNASGASSNGGPPTAGSAPDTAAIDAFRQRMRERFSGGGGGGDSGGGRSPFGGGFGGRPGGAPGGGGGRPGGGGRGGR